MRQMWEEVFSEHHYLSGSLLHMAVADILRLRETGEPVAFVASAPQPGVKESGKTYELSRPTRREHRIVVLPGWQGLSIGPLLSNFSGAMWTATTQEKRGYPTGKDLSDSERTWRYMCRTAHPRFGKTNSDV